MNSDRQDDADNRDVEEKSRNSESEYDEDDERTESAYGTAVDSEKAEGTERYGGAVGKSDQDSIDQEKSALTDNFAQFASADHESLASSLSYLDQQLATLHSLRFVRKISKYRRFSKNLKPFATTIFEMFRKLCWKS